MTPRERRASLSLAAIFGLRMLGLFLILPVFAVHARAMPGGDQPLLIGLALGVYGLTQAALQIPFGVASDRWGRKPVIVAGLLVFALGSVIAALAQDVGTVIIGRAIQGMGAVSAAVSALVADETRDSQRTKAMAMIGATIGLSFALSLVFAPLVYAAIGMAGLFWLTAALALAGGALVVWAVPRASGVARAPVEADSSDAPRFVQVLLDPDLLRLNLGIFVLHTVQMAMFVVLPGWLVADVGLPLPEHWKLYLPVVVLSFAVMMPPLGWGERRGRLREVMLGAIALLTVVALGLATRPIGLGPLAILLWLFFAGFNVLEASLPSLVSRLAPARAKGAALGIYNTTQSLGLFAGGGLGGWMLARWDGATVFLASAVLLAIWLVVAFGQRRWPTRYGVPA